MASENQKCVGVVFSDRAYKDIQTETYDKDPVETGGILLGHVLSTGHWVVVEVIPPGNNSTHQYAYFEYDEHFVNQVADQIADKYEQKLELLGLWHRHPGSMDFFSGTDDGTNIKFAEINPAYGAISGLVNIDPEFRMTMYHVDSPLDYTKVETFVGDDIIPAELLKLKEGATFEEIDAIKKPKTRSEQQPVTPQQTQQTRQTTPNREAPRRTTPSRERHEKPQVVIQRPETGTDVFKKLILEHTTAFCFLVASVVVVLAGVFIFFSSQKTQVKQQEIAANAKAQETEVQKAAAIAAAKEAEAKTAEEERKKQEAEAKKAEEDRKRQEAEAKKAEEDRKRQEADAKKAEEDRKRQEADAKKAEEERKKREADAKKAEEERKKREAEQNQQQQLISGLSGAVVKEINTDSETPDADVAPAKHEEKTEEVGSQPKAPVAGNPLSKDKNTTPAGNGRNEKECADLLKRETNFQNAQKYYTEKLLKHRDGSKYKEHLEKLRQVLAKLSGCETQKKDVQALINNIDPEELKLYVEKPDCNKKDAYKVLNTINTCTKQGCPKGNYTKAINKWKEQCENNSKKKSGKSK